MTLPRKIRSLLLQSQDFFSIFRGNQSSCKGSPPSLAFESLSSPDIPAPLMYRYSSETRGVEAWEKKWDQSQGRRILFLAFKDFSGSFYKWAKAVNDYTPYAVRMICLKKHKYDYPMDLFYSLKESSIDGISSLIDETDIVHIKDEYNCYLSSEIEACKKSSQLRIARKLFEKISEKPIIFTHYGGYARKFSRESSYRDFVLKNFAARVAMTPDLNYEWFDGYFIPHSIDIHDYPYQWRNGKTLMHTPSTSIRKGTDIFNRAVAKMGDEISYDLIQNISHQECLQHKARATLFFDQAGREDKSSLGIDDVIGWYGNNALESMVYGVPTIAHISEQALDGAHRAGKNMLECPIIRVGTDEESMYQAIRNFFNLSPTQKKELSESTRLWVERFHSFEVNAQELAQVYNEVLSTKQSAH